MAAAGAEGAGVAARSYAFATRNPSGDFDAYADTRSQVYGPIEHEAAASTTAVTDTAHQVVWYKNTVATTFFSSSSGGRTASEQAAWGTSFGEPYLVSVIDRYDSADGANPYHTWAPQTYTPAGACQGTRPLRGGRVAADDDRPPSQRVLKMAVTSSAGTSTFTGDQVEGDLGLRSNYFRLLQRTLVAPATAVAAAGVTITGRAWPVPSGALSLERRGAAGTPWQVVVAALHLDASGNFTAAADAQGRPRPTGSSRPGRRCRRPLP